MHDDSLRTSQFAFSFESMDYLIDDVPLLVHLKRHERINIEMYRPAIACNREAMGRLMLETPPDFEGKLTSLYLCSHCRSFDGQAISCQIKRASDYLYWSELGVYDDVEERQQSFKKVKAIRFLWNDYVQNLQALRRHSSILLK